VFEKEGNFRRSFRQKAGKKERVTNLELFLNYYKACWGIIWHSRQGLSNSQLILPNAKSEVQYTQLLFYLVRTNTNIEM